MEPRRNEILLVTADDDRADSTVEALSAICGTIRCRSLKDAVERLEGGIFRLVLLDVSLPNLDARKVVGLLRRIRSCRGAFIVLCSACGLVEGALLRDSGADAFLRLPPGTAEVEALARMLGLQHPPRPCVPARDESSAPGEAAKVDEDDGRSSTILVVEDSRFLSSYLGELLSAHGFKTVSAGSVEAGVYLLKRLAQENELPLLVLMDVNLPGMSGNEAVAMLRSIPETSKLTYVLMSDSDEEKLAELTAECGADAYMLKPIDRARLGEWLVSFLESGRVSNLGGAAGGACAGETTEDGDGPSAAMGGGTDAAAPAGEPRPAGDEEVPELDELEDLPPLILDPSSVAVDEAGAVHVGGEEDEVSNLLSHLRAGKLENRRKACMALARKRCTAAVPELKRIVDEGEDELVELALWAMGEIGGDEAFACLSSVVRSGDLLLKSKAILALGRPGEERAIPILLGVLKEDVEELRPVAVQALAAIGGELARKALSLLCDDSNPVVAARARQALTSAPDDHTVGEGDPS